MIFLLDVVPKLYIFLPFHRTQAITTNDAFKFQKTTQKHYKSAFTLTYM